MSFTIRIDEDCCMGAQRCLYLAPDSFELDDDGIAHVTDLSGLTEERAEKIAFECPNFAIHVEQPDS